MTDTRCTDEELRAIEQADDAGAQWSETFVAEIVKGPIV